ncbi:F0F1 ATP synthase subunit B [Amycolatopsis alkalitolerans]|uniref:ATP synthase subunit b n=1 Tax=Amycolatopsis alkalitolerans TaxID=2547244 RepID=A0A5C4LTW8_9PSEU|nr:F0F1 ATP synthase subunit B [Amycolatopsis alkalitolerans]TNC22092.1 F0F1 ATP synthase subunit B [Amycolatopsis alkalitolerans]
MSGEVLAAGNNFLIPNGTFFVELIIFGIVLLVIWRWVLPPIQKAMKERHDMLQRQLDENHQAAEKFEAAKAQYAEELAAARAESSRIRDEARAEGQAIIDEYRGQAQSEISAVLRRGEDELAAQRARVLADLRAEIPTLSRTLASRVVGHEIGAGHQETVEAFLAEQGSGESGKGE